MIEIQEEIIQNPLTIKLTTNREITGLKLALKYVLDYQLPGTVDYSIADEIMDKLNEFEESKGKQLAASLIPAPCSQKETK